MAGTNAVCVDAVGAAVMGFDPMADRGTAPFEICDSTLRLAEELGVGTRDLKRIEVIGPQHCRRHVRLPQGGGLDPADHRGLQSSGGAAEVIGLLYVVHIPAYPPCVASRVSPAGSPVFRLWLLPRRSGRVKITGFEVHKVTLRWRDLLFVEVKTDAGITGLGEGTLEGREDAVENEIRWLAESYIGKDPGGIEEHWNRSYYLLSRWRNGPPAMTALSAIDIALWDIEGKRLGLPVWRLLEGPLRPRLRAYYTHWNASLVGEKRTPAAFAQWARETRDRGWTAVKWSIPMGTAGEGAHRAPLRRTRSRARRGGQRHGPGSRSQ